MKLSRALFRYGAILPAIYLVASAVAFKPSYFERLSAIGNPAVHVHGWLMGGWLALLVAQAFLIKGDRRAWHRALGRLGYVLAPLVAMSIVFVAHSAIRRSDLDEGAFARLALQLGYAPLFLAIFAMAMRSRHDSAVHARYMICTTLPMTSPVFDRILGFYLMPELAFLPQFLDGSRMLPLIYLLLVGLTVWDWRSHGRTHVFPIVAGMFLIQHGAVVVLVRVGLWHEFATWFAGSS